MFSVGEEFEVLVDEINEYFTCISSLIMKGKEYVIGEDEEGTKRAFLYDPNEDEILPLPEDEEEDIVTFWEDEYFGNDKDYMFWNEDFEEYDKVEKEDTLEDYSEVDETENLEESEEDLEDFVENLLD